MANELLLKLAGGDLRSDGRGNEVADEVIANPALLGKLIEGLYENDEVIRARTAHALERVSRTSPKMVEGIMPKLVLMAGNDPVPMVKWHLAMIFGNLALTEEEAKGVMPPLSTLLNDGSVFVKSWAIVSLTLIGKKYDSLRHDVHAKIAVLQDHPSKAIRTKVKKALEVLGKDGEPVPSNWIKARDK